MVLRKPYAFIIRHFRMIHLMMLACLVFLLLNISDIHNIFATLQSTNSYIYAGATNYIANYVYYLIVFLLFLSGVVYWILKEKKKPTNLYLGLLIYAICLIPGYAFLYNLLAKVAEEIIESDTIILAKDISNIMSLPAYVFIAICFVRGIGFNLKKFNFSKDVAELQIADTDSAEFEVMVGQNNYKYMRFVRRTIREIKYYILENKFTIGCFLGVIMLFFVGYGIYYYNQYLAKLAAEETTTVNGIAYTVRNAYITSKDFNGNVLSDKYKYVVVDMSFYNSYTKKQKLDLDKIILTSGSLVYYPTLNKNGKFYDLGVPYKIDQYILPNSSIDATLTFEVPRSTTVKNFVLKVQASLDNSKKDKIITNYKNFDVSAKNIDTDKVNYDKKLNETVNTNVIGKNQFSFTITDYNIQDSFNSRYISCKNMTMCTPLSLVVKTFKNEINTMLILDYQGSMYDDANFTKTFNTYNKVFANYVTVQYSVGTREYIAKADIVANSDVDGKIFIEVDRTILKGKDLNIVFKFRDEMYKIPLTKNNSTELPVEEAPAE